MESRTTSCRCLIEKKEGKSMSKVAVMYYSSTGNTKAMAEGVSKGAQDAGAEVKVLSVSDASEDDVKEADAVALGCSAMGVEELEAAEFRPFFEKVAPVLKEKKVVLFGSYGWGSGDWMRSWEAECADLGITLNAASVMANEAPDAGAVAECEALGKAIS